MQMLTVRIFLDSDPLINDSRTELAGIFKQLQEDTINGDYIGYYKTIYDSANNGVGIIKYTEHDD